MAIDLLENLNTPAYKIAPFEAIGIPPIRYVAKPKKPMIISTGMADAEEIQDAIDAALGTGCKEIENSKLHSESSQHTEVPRKD
jgi:N-acetylneuraminate synthase